VAYTSDVSGRAEVNVRAFPSGEGPWQVSTEGSDHAQWRRGRGSRVNPSAPRALVRARMHTPGIVAIRNDYVVSPDGQRFLIKRLVEDPAKAAITVVINWVAGLKK
jgi:hypothetical protein